MATEMRLLHDRRKAGRRRDDPLPGSRIDVTRLEHENLYRQVEEVLRMLHRIEAELQRLAQRIERVEEGNAKPAAGLVRETPRDRARDVEQC